MSKNDVRYVVSRCRSDDTLFGPIHCGCDVNGSPCYETLCGQRIDDHWWILGDRDDGQITCKKCLAEFRPNAELSGPRPLAAEGSRSNDVLERTAETKKGE